MSNLQRHKDCTMRSEIGNCLAIGGFCTSVSKEICEALQNAYTKGRHSVEVSEKQVASKLNNPDDSLLAEDLEDCKEKKSKLESDTISRQAAINAIENTDVEITAEEWDELTNAIESLPPANTDLSDYVDRLWKIAYERGKSERPKGEWVSCSEPPEDRRNVFLAYGTNDFKSCCIGHYEQGMGWYEDRNFFSKPIYDCKYWCDIPELPDMGDKQFGAEVGAYMRGDKE